MPLLNLPGLTMDAERTIETATSLTIGVKRRPEGLPHCPHCGGEVAPNGTRRVTYADLPIRGKPTFLDWDRQRFLCKACGKTSSDDHPDLHAQFLMTRRLYDWIGDRSLRTTFASVAADTGLDQRSIRRVFAEWSAAKMKLQPFVTPKWLGMDEVHLLKKARGVLTNIDERTMVDLLPDRSMKTMALRISQFDNKDRIELVAMDMWRPYRTVIEQALPNAKIIIDKWHVLRMANEALERIRKSYRADLSPARRRRLMHDRFLLARREKDLKAGERMILEAWCNEFKPLGAAWRAKEAFYDIYTLDTPRHAREAYLAWQRRLSPEMKVAFQPLVTAMGNWSGPVFNYFDFRVTNAYTESLNRLIGDTDRIGRGYSFDVLRTRMLLARGALKQEGLPPGTFGYREDGEQPFTGVHIPTLTDLIENGQW